ncbi:MAG TPA: glycosyltransferase family 2 protein, partial [Firmicutes bacterium]|nr:glycosyltransferase family 2 protein [Bacillota bacterium]
MGKAVAIIICNFNKKEYVLQCIKSVMGLAFRDYDLYVVDNASGDGSVKAIEEAYEKKVILIKNKENLGGSGGFNTGVRAVLNKGYKYIYLLDNDVILDEQALTELYYYLEEHHDVGIAGSLLYSLDNPTEIQEMGAEIDWNGFYIKPNFKGNLDKQEIPVELECDYVPACSMLVRTEAVKKAGLMDEGNFIYWDDIEWGYRIKEYGYRVVALSESKVWHKMGVAAKTNTFGTYYFWRNRINFFVKYLPQNLLHRFAEQIFSEVFQAIYSCNYAGKHS